MKRHPYSNYTRNPPNPAYCARIRYCSMTSNHNDQRVRKLANQKACLSENG